MENANTSLYHDGIQKLLTTITGIDVTGTAQMDTGITEGIHYVGTAVEHWGDGGTGMTFPANDTISLRTASSDRLYINSSGNVGIGTTSPIGMLSVVNPISNTNTWTPTNNPDLWVSNAGTSNGYYAFGVTTNSGDIFSITNAGNVGIGTTSPGQKLQVAGSIYANGGSMLIDSGQRLKWGNSNQWIEGTNNTSLEFSGGGGGTQMILTSAVAQRCID